MTYTKCIEPNMSCSEWHASTNTQEEEVEQGQGVHDYEAEFAEAKQRLGTLLEHSAPASYAKLLINAPLTSTNGSIKMMVTSITCE